MNHKTFLLYDEFTFNSPDGIVHATIIEEENADGLIGVETDLRIQGKVIHYLSRKQLDNLIEYGKYDDRNITKQGCRNCNQKKEKQTMWDKIKEFLFEWGGCLLWMIPILGIFGTCTYSLFEDSNHESVNRSQFYESNANEDGEDMVYICTGPSAKAYHYFKDCYGLQNCSDEIILVDLEEAEDEDRHLCHFCRKRMLE